MELKEFISESVKQILAGVRDDQDGADGGNVNAKMRKGLELGGNLINAGDLGVISRVDFEVEVAAETSGSGGAKINVVGIFNAEGSGHRAARSANKLTFSIPVLLPSGSDEAAKSARIAEQERMAKANEGLRQLASRLGGQ